MSTYREAANVLDNYVEEVQRLAQEVARVRRRLSEEEYAAKSLREERDKLLAEQSALRARLAEVERERDEFENLADEWRAHAGANARDRDTAREALRVARHALEEIAQMWLVDDADQEFRMRNIARAALDATKGET